MHKFKGHGLRNGARVIVQYTTHCTNVEPSEPSDFRLYSVLSPHQTKTMPRTPPPLSYSGARTVRSRTARTSRGVNSYRHQTCGLPSHAHVYLTARMGVTRDVEFDATTGWSPAAPKQLYVRGIGNTRADKPSFRWGLRFARCGCGHGSGVPSCPFLFIFSFPLTPPPLALHLLHSYLTHTRVLLILSLCIIWLSSRVAFLTANT